MLEKRRCLRPFRCFSEFPNFYLTMFCPDLINAHLNRFMPIVATLMLVLLAFAASHPLLENFELIHHEAAHAEKPISSHFDHELADGNCPINSSRDEIQKTFANDEFHLDATLPVLLHENQEIPLVIEIASSPPPELGMTWQFSSRAALPVRSPSFAS